MHQLGDPPPPEGDGNNHTRRHRGTEQRRILRRPAPTAVDDLMGHRQRDQPAPTHRISQDKDATNARRRDRAGPSTDEVG